MPIYVTYRPLNVLHHQTTIADSKIPSSTNICQYSVRVSATLRNQAPAHDLQISPRGFIVSQIIKLQNRPNSRDNTHIGPYKYPSQCFSAFQRRLLSWTSFYPQISKSIWNQILRRWKKSRMIRVWRGDWVKSRVPHILALKTLGIFWFWSIWS